MFNKIKEKLNRRKNYYINPKFQSKFIAFCFLPAAGSMIFFFSLLQIYFYKLFEDGKALGLENNHPYFLLLNDQRMLLMKFFIVFIFLMFGFYVVWGIWISHKIAGPLYRLNQYLRSLNGLPDRPLKFRENDFFLEIPDAFNEWIKKLNDKN